METWKWIEYKGVSFKDKYMVSNFGNVKSVDRVLDHNRQFIKGRLLKQRCNTKGYKLITLWDNGRKVDIEVHRIVALHFVLNKESKLCVNHINGNKTDNNFKNLEWCTMKENVQHSVNVLGNNPRKWKSKPVIQKEIDGTFVKEWENAWDIKRELGYCQVSISRCCRRVKKGGMMYGYVWDFK